MSGEEIRGLPYARLYAYEDIVGVSSGVEMSFDAEGRLGLVQDGTYAVLNDEVWINRLRPESEGPSVRHVQGDADGNLYFGAVGSWGMLVEDEKGMLEVRALATDGRPDWTVSTEFTRIVAKTEGVYFGSSEGIVFWERNSGRHVYARATELVNVFYHEGRLYVSEYGVGTRVFSRETGRLEPPEDDGLGAVLVAHATSLPDGTTVLANRTNELYLYSNDGLKRLPFPSGPSLGGHITTLTALSDGNFVTAVVGQGLFVVSPRGEILLHLSSSEYQRVTANASNEPGVLWAANEFGVMKILYGNGVTRVGQSLGMPIGWPQTLEWNGQTLVASDGRIYAARNFGKGQTTKFELLEGQPEEGGWGLAAWEDWLFVGNRGGLFAKRGDGEFDWILRDLDVARVVVLDRGICIVIGATQIAALRWNGTSWEECAARVKGVGYPAFAHGAGQSVWLEMGADLVVRIEVLEGEIEVGRFDTFPWETPRWVHVSVLDALVVLSGPHAGRAYYDEASKRFVESEDMDRILEESSEGWPARVLKGRDGRYWVSHARGISRIGRGEFAVGQFRMIDEFIPRIQEMETGSLIVSTGRSFFVVDEREARVDWSRFRPQVVSVSRGIGGEKLAFGDGVRLPYSSNSLSLRLFSGSYSLPRLPSYQFRLNEGDWAQVEGSSLPLSNLREGDYALDIRLVDAHGQVGERLGMAFSIDPPWSRRWTTRILFVALGIVTLFLGAKALTRGAKIRHDELEGQVAERTAELTDALERLEQETRTSATLAERNRLAAEIHDSLEQGFSALSLQLETTSNIEACPARVRAGLELARNMIAFSRDEVRDAVWDLHSRRLEEDGLAGAVRRVLDQTVPKSLATELRVEGKARALSSKVEHHLLRIAQEAVANAVKHGAPQRILVTLEYGLSEIRLSIEDDGCGFDSDVIERLSPGHFGIRYLKTRSVKIGAKLEIASGKNFVGTRISVSVPLKKV